MTQTFSILPGIQVDIFQEFEHVELSPGSRVLDPMWTFQDKAGHGHFARKTPGAPDPLPTLKKIIDPCGFADHDEDCEGNYHYECEFCGEQIVPGTKAAEPSNIPLPPRFKLVQSVQNRIITYEFGKKQWEQVNAAVHEAIENALKDYITNMEVHG